MSTADRFYREAAQQENPLQRALDGYYEMERQRDMAVERANQLHAQNAGLMAELGVLREAFERADNDRIRLQSIASTFMGGIMSLNAVAADLVKLAIKNGVEAAHAAKAEDELDKAGTEVQEVLQRVRPIRPAETAERPMASPRAPLGSAGAALGTPMPPSVGLMRP